MIIWLASYPKSDDADKIFSGFFAFTKDGGSDLSNLNLMSQFY